MTVDPPVEPVDRRTDTMQDELFGMLVEHARDIVLLMTTDGVIVFANAAAEAAYGMSRQELIGSRISDLRAVSTLVELDTDMQRAAGPGVLFETVHVHRSGREFPVEVSARAVTLGHEQYLLSFIRDISTRLERRAEREHLLDDLEVANRQLEGLLAIVSSTVGRIDLHALLRGVLTALTEVMGADASMLFVVEGDRLVLHSFDGLSEEAVGFDMDIREGFAGKVAAAGRPLWTDDVVADALPVWMHAHYGLRAMYGMPLYLDGCLYGVLECAWTSSRLVSEAERVMLQVAADRVMSAIVGAQRYERTARAQQLDAALHLASDRLSASHDLALTMPTALEVAAEAMSCDVAAYGTYRNGVWRSTHCVGMRPGVIVDVPDHPARTLHVDEAIPVVSIGQSDRAAGWLADTLGLGEAVVVPVVLGGEWIGAAVFGRLSSNGGFDDLTLDFARRLSASMSLALANAREYDAEHRIAETLQEALLHIDAARVRVPIGHLYHAATAASRVGGDFYDVFDLPDGQLAVLIGDVSGKGLEAAVFTTLVKHTVRAFAHEERSPAEAVTKSNRVLSTAARLPDFASVLLLYLDPASGIATFCCAGHPPAIVRRAAGGAYALSCGSPVVGAFPEMQYADERVALDPGDVIVMFTDGATDARDKEGEFFGDARLMAAIEGSSADAEKLPVELHARILDFSEGLTADDIAVVALEVPAR